MKRIEALERNGVQAPRINIIAGQPDQVTQQLAQIKNQ